MFKEGFIYYKFNENCQELLKILSIKNNIIIFDNIIIDDNDGYFLNENGTIDFNEFHRIYNIKDYRETQISELQYNNLFNQLIDIENECFGSADDWFIFNEQRQTFNDFITNNSDFL